jgi:glycosyltransferase involved in cell wall biosynthesis
MKIGYLMDAGVPDIRDPKPSGAANHVLRVIQELQRLGHQVRLVARLSNRLYVSDDLIEYRLVNDSWRDRGLPRLAERSLRRIQYDLRLPYAAWFDGIRFAEACRQELAGFDLFYERMGWMGRGGSLAAQRAGVPHVLEVNGDHLRENEMLGSASGGLQLRVSLSVMRGVTRRATHAVTTGEGWRRRHLRNWNVDADKVSVIHNGSDVVDLLNRSQIRSHRSPLPSPGEPLRLIYVGSFDPWQNLPYLLKCVREALNSGIDVQLTIAGSGKARESLDQMTRELELSPYVTFTGHVSMAELAGHLGRADVGISLYDGREEFDGLKLFDYKSAGLATIAAGRNGEPAALRAGITGLIVPPGDQAAFLAALGSLYRDRELVARLGRQARVEAEQVHSWKHTGQSLERLFYSLLDGEKARASAAA